MRRRIVVTVLVAFLGVLSVILGFTAESKRVKIEDIHIVNRECVYPARPALGLGIVSALLLLIAQILISAFAGCICCKKNAPSGASFCIGVTCYILSWVAFAFAFILLVSGAALNSSYRQDVVNTDECRVIRRGIFAGGAVLSLITIVLGIIYFLIATKTAQQPEASQYNQGVAMGQPQMDARPVFVQEDTYRRQQQYV